MYIHGGRPPIPQHKGFIDRAKKVAGPSKVAEKVSPWAFNIEAGGGVGGQGC